MGFSHHEPCSECGSSDGLARYEAGDGYCFVCTKWFPAVGADGAAVKGRKVATPSGPMIDGEPIALGRRKLSQETCSKWRYLVGTDKDQHVQIATYFDKDGVPCAQKIRYPDKTFRWTGNPKAAVLFGQQLWRDGGKIVVVTEGELDALSMSQAQDNRWPVVSVPNGAKAAKRDLAKQVEWLEGYERIVLMLDNDEDGRDAAIDCAQLFTPGKARIASLPLKDANDMLKADRAGELVRAMWEAKTYRPDGIITGLDLVDRITVKPPMGLAYPWPSLNELTHGMRRREMVTWIGGTGSGKTQLAREVAFGLTQTHHEKVGIISLEESVESAALGQVSILMEKRLHLPKVREDVDDADIKTAAASILDSYCFYDHGGIDLDAAKLLPRLRFMVLAEGCRYIVLDHISIMVSGSAAEGDERKRIDELVTKLRHITEELKFGLHIVSHLRRPQGTPHEEGGRITLADIRSSGALGQMSNLVIAAERNQQAPGTKANHVALRVLKNRFSGQNGLAGILEYLPSTGRIVVAKNQDFAKLFPKAAARRGTPGDDTASTPGDGPVEF